MTEAEIALGQTIIVPDVVTWAPLVLTICGIQDDWEAARIMGVKRVIHIYCQSPDDEDNVHTMPNGVKFYTITTEVIDN